ncbi:MAG: NAD(P)/FAD-dependent oxidoreductase [Coriobacteriales bacterium]
MTEETSNRVEAGAGSSGVESGKDNNEAGVAIIGFGTAGVNSVIGLRTGGYDGKIDVFSDTNIRPYSPILTSYFIGDEKTYEECFPWTEDELNDLNYELHPGAKVEKLDTKAHTVTTADGVFPYKKCVISIGAAPVAFGFPKTEGYEPLQLRTMDSALEFKKRIEDPSCKKILISGASMIALKSLEACLNHGLDCSLVGMNPHILDFNALPEAAVRFEKGLRSYGVNLRFGETMKSVKVVNDERGKLEVEFSGGDIGYYDEIIVAHGVRSNYSFLEEGAIDMDRGILVDEFMRTSDPDVYAAGDVVQSLELISKQNRIVGIWKNAARQGFTAGRAIAADIAGEPAPQEAAYKGSIPMNTIAVKDTLFISGGTMEVTDNRHVEVRETEDMTVVYVYEDKPDGGEKLVGFNVTCDHDEAGGDAYDTGAMLMLRLESGSRE